jgi:hypothetical protein
MHQYNLLEQDLQPTDPDSYSGSDPDLGRDPYNLVNHGLFLKNLSHLYKKTAMEKCVQREYGLDILLKLLDTRYDFIYICLSF